MSASDSSPPPSPSSSTSSVDSEDQDISFNKRISPSWKTYQSLFERRGYHLDTAYDVRLYYERVFPGGIIPDSPAAVCQRKAYRRACELRDDELCRDEGLVSVFCLQLIQLLISTHDLALNVMMLMWLLGGFTLLLLFYSYSSIISDLIQQLDSTLSIAWNTFPRYLQTKQETHRCESCWPIQSTIRNHPAPFF